MTEASMSRPAHLDDLSALASQAKTDPVAFGKLYNHYVQPIYRYLFSRVGTAHEAEDLTSQTFMAAFEAMPAYRERGHFAAWLFRIAHSKLMDHFRRNKDLISLDKIENQIGDGDALGQLIKNDDVQQLAALIHRLDQKQRDLIHLRYNAGLSYAEIARILGKREAAVKKSLYRLLAMLKSQME